MTRRTNNPSVDTIALTECLPPTSPKFDYPDGFSAPVDTCWNEKQFHSYYCHQPRRNFFQDLAYIWGLYMEEGIGMNERLLSKIL
jgi:hypothetical protein